MTNPTPSEVADIVGRLTEAQRKAVAAMTGNWEAGPHMDDAILLELTALREAGLVEREFGDLAVPERQASPDRIEFRFSACWWFRLTPLGIAVRSALLTQDKSHG